MSIQNISDTARWVAVYRAMETERPDAIFRDPYARRLAGAKGQEIVDSLPGGQGGYWAMVTRTAVFDEMILDAVKTRGIEVVVNLAAGLDTRPWRLPLPATLQWFDVDLPEITAYKAEMMQAETPHCRYEAVVADLADVDVRRAVFARLGGAGSRALVISEGLLIYLEREMVADLAIDLAAVPSFRYWLFDLVRPKILEYLRRSWGKALDRGGAPFKFGPAEGTTFFSPYGWRELVFRSTLAEADRLHRTMRGWWIWRLLMKISPERERENARRDSGYVLLEHP